MKFNRTTIFTLSLLLLIPLNTLSYRIIESKTPQESEIVTNLLDIGDPGMDWSLKEIISDETILFSNYQGKVVLLDFFATWCVPCQEVIPELAAVRASFSTQQLIIISVGTDPSYDSEEQLEEFASTNNMNWLIVRDTITMTSYYEIESIPTIYIFDTDLNVAYRNVGVTGATMLESVIESILEESGIDPTPNNPSGNNTPADGFWVNNWYWVVILIVFAVIGASVFVQRQIVIRNNKKAREQKIAEMKKRKSRKLKTRR